MVALKCTNRLYLCESILAPQRGASTGSSVNYNGGRVRSSQNPEPWPSLALSNSIPESKSAGGGKYVALLLPDMPAL
jgi:hypothetical protein